MRIGEERGGSEDRGEHRAREDRCLGVLAKATKSSALDNLLKGGSGAGQGGGGGSERGSRSEEGVAAECVALRSISGPLRVSEIALFGSELVLADADAEREAGLPLPLPLPLLLLLPPPPPTSCAACAAAVAVTRR